VLLEAQPADTGPSRAPAAHPAWRRFAWSTLAVLLAIRVFWSWELQFAYPAAMAREDFAGAAAIWNRLAWFGYDDSTRRLDLGWAFFPRDPERALAQFQRAVALRPSAKGWGSIANVYGNRDDWPAALAAYEAGLAVAPEDPDLLSGAGLAALQLGDPARALPLLERADRLRPQDDATQRRLARAQREAGKPAVSY
jgi:tetratricopeptide (TPR) repeat protein